MDGKYASDTKDDMMQAVADRIDGGGGAGKLEIGTAGMAKTLVTYTLETTCGTVSANTLTLDGFPKTVAASAGDPDDAAEARIRDFADADVITELSVGTSSADIILDSVSITSGQNVTINASPTLTKA
jgi:hypothetical protein